MAWGMTGTLATEDPDFEHDAFDVLEHWIGEIDATCNRFRPDSELSRANDRGGMIDVSPTLERALVAARSASDLTDALCDPTVLGALESLGYDRDYAELAGGSSRTDEPRPSPGPSAWSIDAEGHRLWLAPGTRLDLGASAKALLADIVAGELRSRGGALVEVGGDVALDGRGPDGPWVIGISASLEIHGDEPRITLERGGVATSSIATRAWRRGDEMVNHIVDPRSGRCANGLFETATVAAQDCVSANALATAALLWDEDAGERIASAGGSGRLIRRGGEVSFVGGWPVEVSA